MSISKRGARSYLVRVPPFPARTLRTREDAVRVELELKRRKALGEHFEAPAITVGEAMDGTLARLKATGNPSEKLDRAERASGESMGAAACYAAAGAAPGADRGHDQRARREASEVRKGGAGVPEARAA